MKNNQKNEISNLVFAELAIIALVLASCLIPLPVGAQEPSTPGQEQQQQPLPPATVQQQQGQIAPQAGPQNGFPPEPAVPPALTLPAGTVISVRTTQWLSSDKNQKGDSFNATLDQPLIAQGWVVARRGQSVMGQVSLAQKAGRVRGVSQLGLTLSEITLVDGQVAPTKTQLVSGSAGTSNGRDAAAVATTTGIGAIIGAGVNGGEGAGIGAAAGAAAGIIGVLVTRGKPTVVPPETLMSFRLEAPVTISTEQSQVAFEPVSQQDYSGDQDAYAQPGRHPGYAGPPYPPPYYYGPYPYPYYGWGYYPGPFFFRFGGPRFYGFRAFRGGFRR